MNSKEILTLARSISDRIQQHLIEAHINNDKPSRVAAAHCLTVVELNLGVIVLLDSLAQTHAPLLIRAMQESLAIIGCLHKDRNYLHQMIVDDANHNIKTIEGFLEVPQLAAEKQMEDFWLPQLVTEKETLRNYRERKNLKPKKLWKRFVDGGMAQNYASTYGFLSSNAHSNLTSLLARHGTDGELLFAKEFPKETIIGLVKISLGTLIQAIALMPKFTNINPKDLDDSIGSLNIDMEKLI